MSEYIDREAAIENAISQMRSSKSELCMRERFMNLQAADVREVVYCRDCKDWKRSELTPSYHVCTYVIGAQFVRNADDFCSRGERCGAEMRATDIDVGNKKEPPKEEE